MSKYKLIMFDMDGTLIKDRGIFVIAEKLGFINDLWSYINDSSLKFFERSIEIAKLSKGFKTNQYLEIFRAIPLQDHIFDVAREIKKKNIKTAIATDSYQIFANDLREKLGFDYAFANNLLTNNGVITGELRINNVELKEEIASRKIYSICKSCVLEKLCNDLGIKLEESIAIGDGLVDIGMLKRAGLGIAFNASDEVNKNADVITKDMRTILKYI